MPDETPTAPVVAPATLAARGTNTQSIIAYAGTLIVAGTVAAVFWRGDANAQNLVLGQVLGTIGGGIFGYFFGASHNANQGAST